MLYFARNLKCLRTKESLSLQGLADNTNIPKQRIASYEQDRAEPSFDTLLRLSDYFKLSTDILLRKDLSALHDTSIDELQKGYSRDLEGKHLRVLHSTVDSKGKENIEVVHIKSKAGYTAGYNDPEFIRTLPTFQLPFLLKDRKYRMFQIDGDSMLPIPDKAYVIGEFVQDLRSLKDGAAYIVVTLDDGIVFKVVYNQLRKRKKLLLRSLNPAYKPFEMDVTGVVEAWKFTTFLSSEIPDYYGELGSLKNQLMEMAQKLHKLSQL